MLEDGFLLFGLNTLINLSMEKIIIYNLIDALNALQHIPPSEIAEKAVQGICDFCDPIAVLVKIRSLDKKEFEKSAGDSAQIEIIRHFETKFNDLGASSAEFVLKTDNYNILSIASINSPKENKGIILVLTAPDHPYKHIIRPFVEVFAQNITLALTMKAAFQHINFLELLKSAYPDMKHFGVEGILVGAIAEPQSAYWVEGDNIKQVKLDARFKQIFSENTERQDVRIKELIQSIWPSGKKFNNYAVTGFTIGGSAIICIFAGKFKNEELVFSKFRSLITEIDQPTGYDDVVQAFRRLKEDHKQIVKSERVAAILETAVAVNHEINNPLTAVLGNTQLLLMRQNQLTEDVIAKIKVIEKSALRIRQVTQKLMTVIEPVTTSYTNGLDMLDIDKSSSDE